MTTSERLYTTVDVAKICKVSLRTVIRWVDEGKLSSFRTPGGHRRVREKDLMLFLDHYKIPFSIKSKEKGKKILVIEEKKVLERLLLQILRRSSDNYELFFSRNLYEGAVRVGLLNPDLIILGEKHKGPEIVKFCQALSKISETKRTKILILSSSSPRFKSKGTLSLDIHTVVNKSFTIEDVRPHLFEMLEKGISRSA